MEALTEKCVCQETELDVLRATNSELATDGCTQIQLVELKSAHAQELEACKTTSTDSISAEISRAYEAKHEEQLKAIATEFQAAHLLELNDLRKQLAAVSAQGVTCSSGTHITDSAPPLEPDLDPLAHGAWANKLNQMQLPTLHRNAVAALIRQVL
jgi:hypothetical protein